MPPSASLIRCTQSVMTQSLLIFTLSLLLFDSCRTIHSSPEKEVPPPKEILTAQAGHEYWTQLKEGQRADDYYRINNEIFCGETGCGAKPMSNIDINTFEVCVGSKYAKDNNHVYYPLEIICVDRKDSGVCSCTKYIIEAANSKTFRYLNKDYATDGTKAYFRGQVLDQADGNSFKVIYGPEFFYFAVDKDRVFKHGALFPNADPTTFRYDSTDKRNIPIAHVYIIADKTKKWKFTPPDGIELIE